MAAQKNNTENSNNESVDPEKVEVNVMSSYQELSEKCDVVINKIRTRKSKTNIIKA